jgi:D-alanyl-D-alanine dipeptidase
MPFRNWVDVHSLSVQKCVRPMVCELIYAGKDNFLGRPVAGYSSDAADFCLLTKKAALALCEVQNHLVTHHQLGLKVFDGFRPLRAVKDFGHWMHAPAANKQELHRKEIHYPHLEKNQLSALGYIRSDVSNHCFGHTVDTVLISLKDQSEVNMGSIFDYFDPISHPTASALEIGKEAFEYRTLLIQTMSSHGFKVADTEYWHFEHSEREISEPQDFEILPHHRGLGLD